MVLLVAVRKKPLGKGENEGSQYFLLFSKCFSTFERQIPSNEPHLNYHPQNHPFIFNVVKFILCSKRITHYHTMPHFDALKIYTCGKHCEKRRIACNKQFLLFWHCFLPYMELIFHFKCTLKCHQQFVSIWSNLKFCCLVMGWGPNLTHQRLAKGLITNEVIQVITM